MTPRKTNADGLRTGAAADVAVETGAGPAVEIVPVRGRRLTTRFITMPETVYRDTDPWVPPLIHSARRFMNPAVNPFFDEAEIDHFLALDDRGRAVGRISTTIHPDYVRRYGPVGFFGWFESVADTRVSRALLEHAAEWARARGMRRLAGPYSYASTQEFGLLVEGYDRPPALFQPHNPAYYVNLIRDAGFHVGFGTDTYRWSAETDRPAMLDTIRRGDEVRHRLGLDVRIVTQAGLRRDLDVIFDLFTASFAGNHDVTPMSRAMFDFQARELKQFLDPALLCIVERAGEAIGFNLLLADANPVLRAAGGRLRPGFVLRMRRLVRSVDGAVVLMMGGKPDTEGLGIGRVLSGEIAKVGLGDAGRYRTVHSTWIHQDNWQSRALVARSGATPYRSYAVFERVLDEQ